MPETICEEIARVLRENADPGYRAFQAKLMPGVDPARILGVRTPVLRALAKTYAGRSDISVFLDALPYDTYDETNLYGFIISEGKDYAEAVRRVDAVLPFVDNWATCDLLSPRAFRRNRAALREDIERWLSSGQTYTVRFGIEMIQTHYLDEDFDPSLLARVSSIRSDEYYVNMMLAWFFATALTKQWDAALPYITDHRLAPWTHNKAIQKARESRCFTEEQKEYLNSLKVSARS